MGRFYPFLSPFQTLTQREQMIHMSLLEDIIWIGLHKDKYSKIWCGVRLGLVA